MEFINTEQRDPSANEILYPYCNEEKAIKIISKYEKCGEMFNQGGSFSEPKTILCVDNNWANNLIRKLGVCFIKDPLRRIYTETLPFDH